MLTERNLIEAIIVCMIALLLTTGCVTRKTTTTPRSATEQLLLSTATDHALAQTDLEMFTSRKVYMDASYFDSYDPKYAVGTIRDAFSRNGTFLEDAVTNSEIIVEARSGALAINESESMFGIPSVTLPMPLTGPVQTPELAFYKATKDHAYAKFALLARNRQTAGHVYSSGPLDGKSYDKHYRILFIAWRRTDIAEVQKTPEKSRKFQTWFPQYDATNMPATNAPAK